MANLNIKLVKSLNGRIAKHKEMCIRDRRSASASAAP